MHAKPVGRHRRIRAALWLLAGLVLIGVGVRTEHLVSSPAARIVIGGISILAGVGFLLRGVRLIAALSAPRPPDVVRLPQAHASSAGHGPVTMSGPDWPALLRANESMLEAALTPERRNAVLARWRETIEQRAHALSDLIAAHARSDESIEAYVSAMMYGYQIGFLAGRTMPDDPTPARAEAGHLGRMLRDRWRRVGLPVEDAGMNVGVVVDAALLQIVDLGVADGRASERSR